MDTIYVLTNPLFPNHIKIGVTNCLYSRLKKLSTGVPVAYRVVYHKKFENAKKIERYLHSVYGAAGLMLNVKSCGKEWYPFGEKQFFDSIDDFLKNIEENIQWFFKVSKKN